MRAHLSCAEVCERCGIGHREILRYDSSGLKSSRGRVVTGTLSMMRG